MTYSERDLMSVFFKRITACLFDSSEKAAHEKKPTAKGRLSDSAHFRGSWQNLRDPQDSADPHGLKPR